MHFFYLLEELSGYLTMESEKFELSGVVVDTGLLRCDVVLLVLWFLMFQTHCSPSKYQDPHTLQHCAHYRRPESPVENFQQQHPPLDIIPRQHISFHILTFTNAF